MFKNALIDFARNISGAAGYGTLYLNRYQDSSMSTKISAICGKLGINTNTNTNRSYNSGGGFFTNNDNSGNNPTSQHRSYDEIASMIDDDDD
jgi:type IV secretory pathway TraG/TraD family ATPase VirD4